MRPSPLLPFAVIGMLGIGPIVEPRAATPGETLVTMDVEAPAGVGPSSSIPARASTSWEQAWVPVPGVDSDHDGRDDRVHVTWRLPRDVPDVVPVVVEPSPYYAGLRDPRFHDVDVDALHVPGAGPTSVYQRWLTRRGYAYVRAESLGTGGSTGCPSTGAANETAGMVAVVRWLSGDLLARGADGSQVDAPWSSGRVGMIGVSYNGTLANAAAASGVAGLDAVVAVSAISSWYDYYRSQGAVRAPGGYQGEDADVLARAVLTRRHPSRCREEIRSLRRQQARRTGDLTPFWQRRDYRPHTGAVTAGVLTLHGVRDDNVFSDQAGRWQAALQRGASPAKAWWHSGGHGDLLAGQRNREWRRMVLGWFAHHLRGVDNGVLDGPDNVFVTRRGRLRQLAGWSQGDPAALHAGSVAARRGRLGLTPVASGTGRFVDDAAYPLSRLARRGPTRHRLLWRTRPLSSPLQLAGLGSAEVELSVDAPAANLSVGLVHQGPDRTRLVSSGWADPQNHASLAEGEALVPGRRYRLEVELDHVLVERVPVGHRLGLVVASSDHAHTLRPPPGTRVTVHVAGTRVLLPVVGGPAALARALADESG